MTVDEMAANLDDPGRWWPDLSDGERAAVDDLDLIAETLERAGYTIRDPEDGLDV